MSKKVLIYVSITFLLVGAVCHVTGIWKLSLVPTGMARLSDANLLLVLNSILSSVQFVLFYLIVKKHKGMKMSIIPILCWVGINLLLAAHTIININSPEIDVLGVSQIAKWLKLIQGICIIVFSLFLIFSKEKGSRKTSYFVLAVVSILIVTYLKFISSYLFENIHLDGVIKLFTIEGIALEVIGLVIWLSFYVTELNQGIKISEDLEINDELNKLESEVKNL